MVKGKLGTSASSALETKIDALVRRWKEKFDANNEMITEVTKELGTALQSHYTSYHLCDEENRKRILEERESAFKLALKLDKTGFNKLVMYYVNNIIRDKEFTDELASLPPEVQIQVQHRIWFDYFYSLYVQGWEIYQEAVDTLAKRGIESGAQNVDDEDGCEVPYKPDDKHVDGYQ